MTSHSKSIALVAAIAILGALLIGSTVVGHSVEAKTKSKTGRIKVTYLEVGGTDGKGKLTIKNERTGNIIVKADLNFAKQLKSQGDNCCKKTYEFKWKGNHVGDEFDLKVKTNGMIFENIGNLKSGTTKIGIDLNGDDDD